MLHLFIFLLSSVVYTCMFSTFCNWVLSVVHNKQMLIDWLIENNVPQVNILGSMRTSRPVVMTARPLSFSSWRIDSDTVDWCTSEMELLIWKRVLRLWVSSLFHTYRISILKPLPNVTLQANNRTWRHSAASWLVSSYLSGSVYVVDLLRQTYRRSPTCAVKLITICSTASSTTVTTSYVIFFLHHLRHHNTTPCDPGDITCNSQ